MNKFERIQLLRYLGFNTENSVLVSSAKDLLAQSDFLSRFDSFSVRTFHRAEERFGEPHFPLVDRTGFESNCLPLLEEGYSLIVSEPIDPAEATLAGCIIDTGPTFVVEIALGPGTVRRVTHEGRIDKRSELSGPADPACDPQLRMPLRLLAELRGKWSERIDLRSSLYEFSVYSRPVGWKPESTIFWEIRGLDDHDSELEQFYREVVAS